MSHRNERQPCTLRRATLVGLLASALMAPAVSASAQGDEPSNAYLFRLGPLAMNPYMGVKDVGEDYNVFNENASAQRDFTGSFVTGFDGVLRLGVLRGTVNTNQAFVWFTRYADQRSMNNDVSGKLTLAAGPIQPFVAGGVRRTRDRAGYEIDARARRSETRMSAGATIEITPTTSFVVAAARTDIDFIAGETFDNVDLSTALNRREDAASGQVRLALSPVSTLTFEGQAQRDRFLFDPERNADSVKTLAGVEFSPGGLISGRGSVGYKRFMPRADGQLEFEGVVAHSNIVWSPLETTKFDFLVDRDLEYSFEASQGYYVTTGGSGQISQHLVGPFLVIGSGARHWQDYPEVPGRVETVESYSLGLGYVFREMFKLTVAAERTIRRCDSSPSANFDRTRILTTLDYRFSPK